MASKHIPKSKTQEEKENEEISLVNVLNQGAIGLVAGRPPQSSPSPLATPGVGPTESMALPLALWQGTGLRLKNPSGYPIWLENLPVWSKAVPFEAISYRCSNSEGQPTGCYWAYTPFSTSDLLNWENSNPSYSEDLQRTADLITSIFATHPLSWTDVQALLNILLTVDDRQLIINKANKKA